MTRRDVCRGTRERIAKRPTISGKDTGPIVNMTGFAAPACQKGLATVGVYPRLF